MASCVVEEVAAVAVLQQLPTCPCAVVSQSVCGFNIGSAAIESSQRYM
jgi:hypothetical protein